MSSVNYYHCLVCLDRGCAFCDQPNKSLTGNEDRGMKYDDDKPRMDLLVSGCPNALEAVASVLTFGAKKYAAHSWQTVPHGNERYLAAQLRHITAVQKGEQLDPESGMHHLAHAACNALFILELALRKQQEGKA